MKYLLLICLSVFISCNNEKKESPSGEKTVEKGLLNVQLENLAGEHIDMAQLKGKAVFINFWATWCRPCIMEMPSIQKAMEKLKSENIVFLFPSDEPVEKIQQFKSEHEYGFNYVRSLNTEALNIMALPTTFIYSPGGKLIFSEAGSRNWDSQESIDLLRNSMK